MAFLSASFLAPLTLTLLGGAISYYDLKERRLPNGLVLLLLIGGIGFAALENRNLWEPLLGVLLLGGGALVLRTLYSLFRKKEGLGMGDVKLLGALGGWMSPSEIPTFLIYAGAGGLLFGLLWLHQTGQKHFPFAPAIFLGYLLLRLLPLS